MRTPMKWMAVSGLVLALAACSAGGDDAGAETADGGVTVTDEGGGFEPGAADEEAAAGDAERPANGAPFGEGLNLTDPDRSVITTGTVTLSSEDPVGAAGRITTMVGRMGGWVEAESLRAGTEHVDASAHIVLRLPSSEVGTALGQLAEYGTIAATDLERTDVTLEVRDLEARIRAVEMSVARMEALLAEARSREDLIEAERMLTERQSQLEQLLTQQRSIADQVSMSTLSVDIVVPEEVPPPPPEPEEPATGFLGGLENGWRAFLDFGGVALLVIGALLPWIVFASALVLAALVLRRVWVQRRPERPAKAAAPAPAPGPGAPVPGAWATAGGPPIPPVPPVPTPAVPSAAGAAPGGTGAPAEQAAEPEPVKPTPPA